MHLNMNGLTNISEHDDEMFLEAFAATSNEGMSTLERDPELLMGKFDDAFSNTAGDDLFRNNEDVFFGSP
jgi:regulatory protein SWI5